MLFAPSGPQSPRRRNRIKAILTTMGLVLALYLLFFTPDSRNPARAERGSYAQQRGTDKPDAVARKQKELVVASMKDDDTSWLYEFFPEWSKSVYVVDDKQAPLTVTQNKGRESMVYLT